MITRLVGSFFNHWLWRVPLPLQNQVSLWVVWSIYWERGLGSTKDFNILARILSLYAFETSKKTFIWHISHACRSYFLTHTSVIVVLMDLLRLRDCAKDASRRFLSLLYWSLKLLSILLVDNSLLLFLGLCLVGRRPWWAISRLGLLSGLRLCH